MNPEDDTLDLILKSHPIPNQQKLDYSLDSLDKLRDYYLRLRMDATPDKLRLYDRIESTLAYSKTTILLYAKLSRRLQALKQDKKS